MKVTSRRGGILGAAILGGLLVAAPAAAGPNSGKISFSVGNDFTTTYFFRGIAQESRGLIMEPWGEVGVNLYETEDDDPGPFTGLTLIGGIWLSVQTEKTGAVSGPSNLYETDYYGGFKFNMWHFLDIKTMYYAYSFPNGAYPTAQEVTLSGSVDDSEWLGAFALYPSLLVAIETDNTAFGEAEGEFMGFSIRPTYTVEAIEDYPITLAMPCNVGIGLANYYETAKDTNEDNFGYFSGGFTASIPLAFVPEDYGSWSFTAGAQVYTFGHNVRKYNESLDPNFVTDPWVVGTWSLAMTY